jgi:putative heme-binding domain-containing protein
MRAFRALLFSAAVVFPSSMLEAQNIDPSISDFVRQFKGRGAIGEENVRPLSPGESLKAFSVADGLEMQLVASEPEIAQPLAMHFDARGRLWVVQYIQYPFPAGLKILKYDQYLRAVFDKVPEPPPSGVKGIDKITILEPDGHGGFAKSKDFLSDLNIATSVLTGHGGVWVMNPPYLLFYKTEGDKIVGDPEVRLSGFGLEDTHAVANGLRWGPDGWIYGATGSTTTATVNGISFLGQSIWRYHPKTREFELFAEGGGNTWGVEFDDQGRLFSGTNNSDVRGLHFVQGGYYVKNFGKHGPLTNPYTFGYFEHMAHHGPEKLTHVVQPFIVYGGGALPSRFNGQVLNGVALSNRLQASRLQIDGSTFDTDDTEALATTPDRWFRPVAMTAGPDGAVYVADWYDIRLSHVDPRDTWDRSNGRIFRLQAKDAAPPAPFDLEKLSNDELISVLSQPNRWFRETARRVIADRGDASLAPKLKAIVERERGLLALEALWALHVSGEIDEEFALRQLEHPNEFVRAWMIRLTGDTGKISPRLCEKLVVLARTEPSNQVRSQLASSCKRWPVNECLSIVRELVTRYEDAADKHIPLLLWWAIERNAVSSRDVILEMLADKTVWNAPIFKGTIAARLAQRFMAERNPENFSTTAKLLALAPDPESKGSLIRGIDEALREGSLQTIPVDLQRSIATLWREREHTTDLIRIAARLGIPEAIKAALEIVANPNAKEADRKSLIGLVAEHSDENTESVLLGLLENEKSEAIKVQVLNVLQQFDGPRVADTTIALFPKMSKRVRDSAIGILTSRPAWSNALLQAVDRGEIKHEQIPAATVAVLQMHASETDKKLIKKHWGVVRQSSAEKEARIAGVFALLSKGKGEAAAGHELFKTLCATCHTLKGEGGKIGPDLTGYERDNLGFLLPSIVDPSLAIRDEYVAFSAETKDGQFLTGFLLENTPQSVTISDLAQNKTTVPRDRLKKLEASSISLMPEGLLDALNDQQVRDLLTYVMAK